MPEKQDPKDVENKQETAAKATDELTDQELGQVAGGGIEPSPFSPPAQPSLPDDALAKLAKLHGDVTH
jgi:hypothetical protein